MKKMVLAVVFIFFVLANCFSMGKKQSSDNPEFQYNLGQRYFNEENYPQAVYWWEKAAEQEYAEAQYSLGVCYQQGLGVKHDYIQAVYWFRKAAEQGHIESHNNLGIYYAQRQDYEQAVYWWEKAAKQGHSDSQYNLGVCYDQGLGVPQDYEQAEYWYRKAAEH